jgi:uncharacterized membrane protein YsdA (DUF1294 family)
MDGWIENEEHILLLLLLLFGLYGAIWGIFVF